MSLRRRVALAIALPAALSPLAASAADGAEWTFDEKYDFEFQDEHAKAVEERVETAETFAPGLMQRAANGKIDLKPYVEDARHLADLEPPASAEYADKLAGQHQGALKGVETLVGLPGLFGALRGGSSTPIAHVPLGGSLDGGFCGECENLVFEAPFPGYFSKTYPLGWAVVSPEPVTGLTVDFRSGVVGAGHTVGATGQRFTAPPGLRHVAGSATMNIFTDVGVGGLGVAHGWSDVQFVIKDAATGAEQCRTRLETSNLAAGAWYARDVRDHGERTLGCRFERDPSSEATFDATIELRAYGTYAGLVGGHSIVRAEFKRIDVELCP